MPMTYYEVLVASQRYHGEKPLTYESDVVLPPGSIVTVFLQNQKVPAVIINKVSRPTFNTKLIDSVISDRPIPLELINFIHWLKDYYPSPLGSLVSLILPAALVPKGRETSPKDKSVKKPKALPPLTKEQKQAITTINRSKNQAILLHGSTGTGKTRVYIDLANQNLVAGRSVLILTPEIGLTPQLAKSFEESFPGRVTILHSNLTPAERRDRFIKIHHTDQAQVVVGPRSALFAPVHQLGLIVMDEAHDDAYKQEQQPHYQTSRAAAALAKTHNAQLVMGSATPLVADYYAFKEKSLPIIQMRELAIPSQSKTDIKVIPLTDRTLFTKSAYLSNHLIKTIEETLANKEQSLIYLNRRGTARLVLCEQCGWTASCPNCDLTLTYHSDTHNLRCHVCSFKSEVPTKCPSCGHTDILFRSIGTKSLAEELKRLFPDAKISRFDTDLARDERLEASYEQIVRGDVDILVGTRILAKGLDLPKLSLVGIVMADSSLYLPDFMAEEHNYQLLSQIVGRVGRGHRHGRVVVQTYHPDNPALKAAIDNNYQEFYDKQIEERRVFGYPPFTYLLKIKASRASSKSAEMAISKIKDQIGSLKLAVDVIGPSPSFHNKSRGNYNWQLVVKSRRRGLLLEIINQLPKTVTYDIDPTSLL